jgi:hypothetical protein
VPFYGSSVQDELLRMTGSTGQPFETISTATTLAGASGSDGAGVYIGERRGILARLIIAGAVTGTSPTLNVKFQDSADGTTFTDMGIAYTAYTGSMYAGSTTGGALVTEAPALAVYTRTGRPYVRVSRITGGTTPSFASVAVLVSPIQDTHG